MVESDGDYGIYVATRLDLFTRYVRYVRYIRYVGLGGEGSFARFRWEYVVRERILVTRNLRRTATPGSRWLGHVSKRLNCMDLVSDAG